MKKPNVGFWPPHTFSPGMHTHKHIPHILTKIRKKKRLGVKMQVHCAVCQRFSWGRFLGSLPSKSHYLREACGLILVSSCPVTSWKQTVASLTFCKVRAQY